MSAELIRTIERSARLFYQLKIDAAIASFVSLAEIIERDVKNQAVPLQFMQHIQVILNECMTALQKKEYILLADLLRYEILIPLNEAGVTNESAN
jgi:hypothetical protein